jgi:hypothetical protein
LVLLEVYALLGAFLCDIPHIQSIAAAFQELNSSKIEHIIVYAGIYAHWVAYVISNTKQGIEVALLDSKNREILDLGKRQYTGFVENYAIDYLASTGEVFLQYRKDMLLQYMSDHYRLTKLLYRCAMQKRSLLELYFHSQTVKLMDVHIDLLTKLSKAVGLANSEYDCCKLANISLVKQKVLAYGKPTELLEIVKTFTLDCHPYIFGKQILEYTHLLKDHISQKDLAKLYELYAMIKHILKDYEYDELTDDSYFIAKHKKLCYKY